MRIKIKRLSESARIPTRGSGSAAGADLYACTDTEIMIEPHETAVVRTGIAAEIPEGYVGLVYARSGIASKRGLAPANKVGVIDSDYRGEIMVYIHNHGAQPAAIQPYERFAQLVIAPVLTAEFEEVEELSDTERGAGGFGSTGQ